MQNCPTSRYPRPPERSVPARCSVPESGRRYRFTSDFHSVAFRIYVTNGLGWVMSASEKIPISTRILVYESEMGGQLLSPAPEARRYRALLCPFHAEKTGSFYVTKTGFWHCYGKCNRGGDVIDFICLKNGLSFVETLQYIDARYGTTLYKGPETAGDEQQISTLYRIYEYAASWYHATLMRLPKSHPAVVYLRARNVTSELIRIFRIGYGGDNSCHLLSHLQRNSSLTADDLHRSELFATARNPEGKRVDRFNRRIIFPIYHDNRVVSFAGRHTYADDAEETKFLKKYVNGATTPIFQKQSVLFGLHQAKGAIANRGYAIVVEGYFDVAALFRVFFPNTVGIMGSAFTQGQIKQLRTCTDRLVLFLDPDATGRKTTVTLLPQLMAAGFDRVEVLDLFELATKLGTKTDPAFICDRYSASAIAQMIEKRRKSPAEFYFEYALTLQKELFQELLKQRPPESLEEAV